MVIVVGRPSYAESGEVVAEAVRVLAAALPKATFLPALRRGNVFGALDMGLAPGCCPAGSASRRAGVVHRGLGLGAGRHRLSRPGSWPPWPARRRRHGHAAPRASLVLLGADPLGDFPDRTVAEAALVAGHFVVAVTGHPSESVDAHADVVLPCAVAHERSGTTTNLEGRVSRLGQKLTAPGFAWPDWMIAAELAAALGADLGVTSNDDLVELMRTAPAYAGLTQTVLHSDGAHDGIVMPVAARRHRDTSSPSTPWPCPGSSRSSARAPRPGWAPPPRPGSSRVASWAPPGPAGRGRSAGSGAAHVPPADNYALRLVARRRLYDAGSSVTGSPSLTPLVPTLVARANPYDLDRLGAKTGDQVRVRSARGALVLAAEADAGVPAAWWRSTTTCPDPRGGAQRRVGPHRQPSARDRRAPGVGVIAANPCSPTRRPADAQRRPRHR